MKRAVFIAIAALVPIALLLSVAITLEVDAVEQYLRECDPDPVPACESTVCILEERGLYCPKLLQELNTWYNGDA